MVGPRLVLKEVGQRLRLKQLAERAVARPLH